jgi:hypothetical protein
MHAWRKAQEVVTEHEKRERLEWMRARFLLLSEEGREIAQKQP